jgi:hypothetical protein
MHRVRAADRGLARLGQAVVQDLPFRDQLGERPDGLLDRRLRIHPVLVVEIDAIGAEALQRALDRAPHVRRRAVEHPASLAAGVHAELRGDHDAVAPSRERTADKLLVRVRAVHLGGVEHGDAEIERTVDRADGLGLVRVRTGVEGRHAHAAEPEPADGEGAESRVVHEGSLSE